MSNQIIIVCDDEGKPTGEYVPKAEGITGDGKHHLAITVLLQNSKGKVLLQKRKHLVFDNLWDFTGATDLSHFEDGSNETFDEATIRCLKREWGIRKIGETMPAGRQVRVIGAFNYFAKYGELCENEHCAILIGEYNGPLNLNPNVGYKYKWMDKKMFLEDIKKNPQKYTPWVVEGVKILKSKGFFNVN